jgi:hypothetical protein
MRRPLAYGWGRYVFPKKIIVRRAEHKMVTVIRFAPDPSTAMPVVPDRASCPPSRLKQTPVQK